MQINTDDCNFLRNIHTSFYYLMFLLISAQSSSDIVPLFLLAFSKCGCCVLGSDFKRFDFSPDILFLSVNTSSANIDTIRRLLGNHGWPDFRLFSKCSVKNLPCLLLPQWHAPLVHQQKYLLTSVSFVHIVTFLTIVCLQIW